MQVQEKVLCIGLCTTAEGKERFKSLPYGTMPNKIDNLAAHGLQTTTKGIEGKMQTEKLFCKQYVDVNPARRRHFKPRSESCKRREEEIRGEKGNRSEVG